MLTRPGLAYAASVAPDLLAMASPSEDGAVRDIMIGIPIRAHLSTMSEVSLPVV